MAYKGRFRPKNPEKYLGNPNDIIYRSLKERSIMQFLDGWKYAVRWGSEEVIVPYKYDVDNKIHRYFVDFIVYLEKPEKKPQKLLLEYKPEIQTKPPKKPKTKKGARRYNAEAATYIKNRNKWAAAEKFAEKHGMKFYVISEKDVKGMEFFIHV